MKCNLASFIILIVCFSTVAFAEELPYGALAHFGHGTVTDAQYLPDGNLAISTSKGIKILNAEDGAVIREFTPAEYAGRIAVSPDGTLIANSSLTLWDIHTGAQVGNLPSRSSEVFAFSPDGKLLASDDEAAHDQVSLWDVLECKLLMKLEDERKASLYQVVEKDGKGWSGGPPRTNALAFSRDGRLLAVASNRTAVEIWDVATGKILRNLEGHESWVESVTYSPDGKWLVSSEWLGKIILWDTQTFTPVWTKDLGVTLYELLFTPNRQTLIVNSQDNVQLWDVNNGQEKGTVPIDPYYKISISPDGKRLATIDSASGNIIVWDMPSNSLVLSIDRYSFYHGARLAGCYFAVAGGRCIKIWDIDSQKIARIIDLESIPPKYDISSDGAMLAVLQIRSQEIHLWNLIEGKKVASLKVSLLEDELALYYSDLRFNARGNRLAFGTPGSPITLWNVEFLKAIGRLGRGESCGKLLFSHDGKRLAQFRSSSVVLWDMEKKEPINFIWLDSGRMVFAFNAKGDFLTIEQSGREINVRNNSTNELMLTIDESLRQYPRAFSPDGAVLVTEERKEGKSWMVFWDVEKAQVLMTLEGYYAPTFSQDGSLLAMMSEDETYWIWDFEALLSRARIVQPKGKKFITFGNLKSTMLLQNYPNPSNPETWVPFILAQSTPVKMIITDVTGKKIRQLNLGIKDAGVHFSKEDAVYWDGKNEFGEPVASGVYFYTLKTPNFSQTRRMVIIR
jgi:WD40 repeat protein